MFRRLAFVTGMPRSGTSWIGQILDSSRDVRYRFTPLFSYELKHTIAPGDGRDAWRAMLERAYRSDNEFMSQQRRRELGEYPRFDDKSPDPELLVCKFDRFHELMEEALHLLPELQMIGIVRHPCGAIHSWLTAPKEFPPAADPLVHWRSGACKKAEFGDHFGFDDWCMVTRMFMRLAREHPQRFRLVRYEAMVADALAHTRSLFDWLGLAMTAQTEAFLSRSQSTAVAGDYSVFKLPAVKDRWRAELIPEIRDAILAELRGTDLAVFLDEPG